MQRTATLACFTALMAAACAGGPSVADDVAASTTSVSAATDQPPATSTTEPTTTTLAEPVRPAIPVPEATDIDSLLALDRPVVIAHAGGDQSWPHSTMYAYHQSALAGSDVLEMDVQLTGDGVLVVQHDDTVDRTTEASGRVRDLTYDELQSLDNGFWASGSWGDHDLPESAYTYRGVRTGDADAPDGFTAEDFRVETFRSIAEAFPNHPLDIEIKIPDGNDGEPDLELAIEAALVLAREIDELGRTDSVIVTSFNDDVMVAFSDAAPEVATSPGVSAMFGWITGSAGLAPTDRVLQIPPSFEGLTIITPTLLRNAHDQGFEVWEWGNEEAQENGDFYSLMIAMGVDGIIAGRPAAATERFAAEATNPPADQLLVLVTNDDGVGSPGIDALVEALRSLPNTVVRVVAPAENQSGTSDSVSDIRPSWGYASTSSGFPAVAVDGFPADSVELAIEVLGIEPDLVISGINEGQNVGPLVEISGTVGAARTAARAGFPALAASQGLGDPADFASGVIEVLAWLESFRSQFVPGADPGVYNLNIPTCPSGEVRGILTVEVATDPAGRNAFDSDCVTDPPDDLVDDIDAIIHGWASLSLIGF